MSPLVLPMEDADLAAFCRCFRDYYDELRRCGVRYALNEAQLEQTLQTKLRSRMVCCLKAVDAQGAMAGFLIGSAARLPGEYLARGKTATGFVQHVYVVPAQRRRGVAWALLCAAEQWFAERALGCVCLDVLCQNEAAAALYRALGYAPMTVTMYKQIDETEQREEP